MFSVCSGNPLRHTVKQWPRKHSAHRAIRDRLAMVYSMTPLLMFDSLLGSTQDCYVFYGGDTMILITDMMDGRNL